LRNRETGKFFKVNREGESYGKSKPTLEEKLSIVGCVASKVLD
jgi:hypothetical protein